nr:MmgE/PrpD family protein [uncultured Methanobacterium sp.]
MITRDLAEFIAKTSYPDLPEAVVNQAKLCFLDFLGVSLRGSRSESARIVRNILSTGGNPHNIGEDSHIPGGSSTIICENTTTPLDAALANGVSAHCLDLDDGHRLAQLHPGACVIPAALALAESYHKTGKEFITALVVGYQVAIKTGMILNPGHRQKGFHSTGTCGTLGAAAAAAKIMEMDEEGILNALGLAGTQAAGLLESDHAGSMAKHLHAGKAAQSGVLSALLAKDGFTGAHNILEGKEGLFKAMGKQKEGKNSLEKYRTENCLHDEFEILRVYFKKYPVCRHLHSSLDAAISIMKNKNLQITDIQDITVETYEIASDHNNYHPKTAEGIRQSLPVSLALTIIKRNLDIGDIPRTSFSNENSGTGETNRTNEIAEITSKIRIKCDEDLNKLYPQKRPSKVTITTRKHAYTERIDLAKGEPENPFTRDEILNKFINLNPHVNVNVLKVLDDLEDANIKELMNSLNPALKIPLLLH